MFLTITRESQRGGFHSMLSGKIRASVKCPDSNTSAKIGIVGYLFAKGGWARDPVRVRNPTDRRSGRGVVPVNDGGGLANRLRGRSC